MLWVSVVRVVASPILAILIAMASGLSPFYSIALVISFSLPTAKMAFALAESRGVYVRQMRGCDDYDYVANCNLSDLSVDLRPALAGGNSEDF